VNRATRIAHFAAVIVMAGAVLIATADGFAQSWVGLYQWALAHGLTDWRAASFPLMVDVFILVGELGLFALALEGHKLTRHAMPWLDLALPAAIAVIGWCVSLAFNIGHADHDLSDRVTAAVPPVASMLGLLVLLRTLHRLVGQWAAVTTAVAECGHQVATTLEGAAVEAVLAGLSQRRAAEEFKVSRDRLSTMVRQSREVAGVPAAPELTAAPESA
jgi:hypothetical protein